MVKHPGVWEEGESMHESFFLFYLQEWIILFFGFHPNSPRFGIAHALCLGLAPWLAAEIPILVDSGMIKHKDDTASSSEP